MELLVATIKFLFWVIDIVLTFLWIAIIANAILSWLFAFDVVNYRNRFVYQVATLLDRVTSPILAPLRRIIPSLGGIDITPIIALIAIQGLQTFIVPALYSMSLNLVGG